MKKLIRQIVSLDEACMHWIQSKRSTSVTALMRLFTRSGDGKVWVGFAILFNFLNFLGLHWIPAQGAFLRAMLCALLAWGVGSWVKRLVNRPRPTERTAEYSALVTVPLCRSFPSSHAASSVAFATALSLVHHEWAIAVTCWAAVVTISRFYLGVHFLSDLFAGIVLGVICGFAIFPVQGWLTI